MLSDPSVPDLMGWTDHLLSVVTASGTPDSLYMPLFAKEKESLKETLAVKKYITAIAGCRGDAGRLERFNTSPNANTRAHTAPGPMREETD